MRNLYVLLFIGNALLLPCHSQADATPSQTMTREMKRVGLRADEVGGGIWDLQDGHALIEHRAEKSLIPASLSKIVTALAMLDSFPNDTRFETRALASSPIKNGVIHGDLMLVGGGDPAFISESMGELAAKIKSLGITTITGNLLVDDGRFDDERFDSHRESKRVDRAYDAPIGALSFDWNAVSIYVRPGDQVSSPAIVHVEPLSPYLKITNNAKTTNAGSQMDVAISRTQAKDGDIVAIKGRVPVRAAEKAFYKSISQPDLWTAANFVEFLKREGVSIGGSINLGASSADKKYELLAAQDGPSIGELVLSMMKFSNNFIAEMLTKNLAIQGELTSRGASMEHGIHRIQSWLKARTLKGPAWTFVNPSGLTNENRLTPSQLGQLLKFGYDNIRIYPEFTASLPIAGLDGTLKHRARGAEGQIRAKTGLLKDAGVAALAGYATNAQGRTRAFVWIVNQTHPLRNLQGTWNFLDAMATVATSERE